MLALNELNLSALYIIGRVLMLLRDKVGKASRKYNDKSKQKFSLIIKLRVYSKIKIYRCFYVHKFFLMLFI